MNGISGIKPSEGETFFCILRTSSVASGFFNNCTEIAIKVLVHSRANILPPDMLHNKVGKYFKCIWGYTTISILSRPKEMTS